MTSRDFCYWLQGFFELEECDERNPLKLSLNLRQVEMIKKHLHLVFEHEIDPSFGNEEKQKVLNEIHKSNNGKLPLIRC